MSFSYSRYDRQQRRSTTSQRTAWNYWLPIGITVASAAIGFAVWAWNERRGSEEEYEDTTSDEDRDESYATGYNARATRDRRAEADLRSQSQGEVQETIEVRDVEQEQRDAQEGMFSRVSGAIRRTPSPQQLFTGASKTMAAGAAAAGAFMGRGLTALKENEEDFEDHERWSDEAEKQSMETSKKAAAREAKPPKKKRMVCVVVSAEERDGISGMNNAIQHASILSHLPLHVDSSIIDLLVLIYAPQLTSYPAGLKANPSATSSLSPDTARPKAPRSSSNASSFSNIAASEAAEADRDDGDSTQTSSDPYAALQSTALRLVPHPTHILPFTTPSGHIHLLRHLSPSLVYMQEELCGTDGENVKQVEGWVGQVVVVVGGEGLGADTETEAETEGEGADVGKARRQERRGDEWWKNEKRVGLGRTEVVEGERFEEDWIKRVSA